MERESAVDLARELIVPGLVGLISKQPSCEARAQLNAMLKAVQYEEFYGSGTWIDESLGVYVGWTAQKGAFCDQLPVSNERDDIHLIFSGEEYSNLRNAQQLRAGVTI